MDTLIATRDVDKCQWSIDSTRELIRLYDKERNKFSTVNQGGKHLLWGEIAQQMSNIGFQYSANSCSDKWRNLKMTYKNNKQRELKYGLEYVKWVFFKDLDNIFQNSQECKVDYLNISIQIILYVFNFIVL